MKNKVKDIIKEFFFFTATLFALYLAFGAINKVTPVFADTTDYDVNVYAMINGSLGSSPVTISGKAEGIYVELQQDLVLKKNDKTYLLKGWENYTTTGSDGIPKYTYRDVNTSEGKAILGFYMPSRDVNIKVVYEESTTYGNNTSNILRRIDHDDEYLTGSLWQVSSIYMPTEGTTLNTLSSDISSYVKDGVGDSIVYSANPFLSNGSTYNKTINFDAGSAGSNSVSKRAGDLVVYAIPYALNGHYIDDSSITITKENGSFTFINNAMSYNGDNTFFLKRYAIDSKHDRYILLIFTMPDDNVTITANYPTAIPIPQSFAQTKTDTELSPTINSKGKLKINFEDGRASVLIDADDIQNNRDKILALKEQVGSSDKMYVYQIGNHIYFVTGSHTNINSLPDDATKLAVIAAEKKAEPFVAYGGSDITLVPGGNSTWQQVY